MMIEGRSRFKEDDDDGSIERGSAGKEGSTERGWKEGSIVREVGGKGRL